MEQNMGILWVLVTMGLIQSRISLLNQLTLNSYIPKSRLAITYSPLAKSFWYFALSTTVLRAKFPNDLATGMEAVDERDFARFEPPGTSTSLLCLAGCQSRGLPMWPALMLICSVHAYTYVWSLLDWSTLIKHTKCFTKLKKTNNSF